MTSWKATIESIHLNKWTSVKWQPCTSHLTQTTIFNRFGIVCYKATGLNICCKSRKLCRRKMMEFLIYSPIFLYSVLIGCLTYTTFRVIKYSNKRVSPWPVYDIAFITSKRRLFTKFQTFMKNKIKRKLTDVTTNLNKLEEHLEANGEVVKCKEIVQLPVDQLTQKLQNGTLSCVEVLRAYQTKVLKDASNYFEF